MTVSSTRYTSGRPPKAPPVNSTKVKLELLKLCMEIVNLGVRIVTAIPVCIMSILVLLHLVVII